MNREGYRLCLLEITGQSKTVAEGLRKLADGIESGETTPMTCFRWNHSSTLPTKFGDTVIDAVSHGTSTLMTQSDLTRGELLQIGEILESAARRNHPYVGR